MVQEMNWVKVCSVDELLDSGGVGAMVDGQQVAIFKVGDAIYALDNYDPFAKANVLSRGIVGDVSGVAVVASPIYKQHFDLRTGQCLEDDAVKLKTYATRLVDGTVFTANFTVNTDSAAADLQTAA